MNKITSCYSEKKQTKQTNPLMIKKKLQIKKSKM